MVCLDYHKTVQSIIDDMEKRIDDYFENVSQEQLEIDVRYAGYERYKKLEDRKIFSN